LRNEIIDKIIEIVETENMPKINDKNYEYKDIKFLKQLNLKDHTRTRTGEKPYICSHLGAENSL